MASYRGRDLTIESGLNAPPIIVDSQADLASYDVDELNAGQLAIEAVANGNIWMLSPSKQWVIWA